MKTPDEMNVNDVSGKNWFIRKYNSIILVIKSLLTQGISPQKISFAMAIGFIVGTFPILGTHTLMGVALAFVFRLNQVAVYLGSWLSAPVYVLLLLPSLRAGEYLMKAPPMELDAFVEGLKRMIHSWKDFIEVWTEYGHSILHIIIGWIPLAAIVGLVVYFTTLYLSKVVASRKSHK